MQYWTRCFILFIFIISAGCGIVPDVEILDKFIASVNIKFAVLEDFNNTPIDPDSVTNVEFNGQKIPFQKENGELSLSDIEFKDGSTRDIRIYMQDGNVIVMPLKVSSNLMIKRPKLIEYEASLLKNPQTKKIESVDIINKALSTKEILDQKKNSSVIFHINRPILYDKSIMKAWIDYHPVPIQLIGITDNGDLLLDAMIFSSFVKPYSRLRFIVAISPNKYILYNIAIKKPLELKFKAPSKAGEILPVTFEKPTKVELNLDINIKILEEERPIDINYTPPNEEPSPIDEVNTNATPTPSSLQDVILDTTFELNTVEDWDTSIQINKINVNDITNITINNDIVPKSSINIEGYKLRIKQTEPDGKKIFKFYMRDGNILLIKPALPDNINDWRINKRPLDYKIRLIKDNITSQLVSANVLLENAADFSNSFIEKMLAQKSVKMSINQPDLYNKPVRKVWIDLNKIPREAVYVSQSGDLWIDSIYINKYTKQDSKIFILAEISSGKFKLYQYIFMKPVKLAMQNSPLKTIMAFNLINSLELKLNYDIKFYNEYTTTENYEPNSNDILVK